MPEILSLYQPSRASMFSSLLFSHFHASYGHSIETLGACSWISKLPQEMATTFSSKSMTYSVRATFMIFYGFISGSKDFQTEARRSYIKALEIRRADLSRELLQPHGDPNRTSGEAICVTIMLSYFELVVKTTQLAWMQHMDAAATLLEIQGPEECRRYFIHQLFRTVRLSVVSASLFLAGNTLTLTQGFLSIYRRVPHVFDQENWKTIPFLASKTELDRLVDVILAIPVYIALADTLPLISSALDSRVAYQNLQTGLTELITQLDHQAFDSQDVFPSSPHIAQPSQLPNDILGLQKLFFSDPLHGCLAAIKHTAYLICFALLVSINITDSNSKFQAIFHSEALMSAILYVDSCSETAASNLYMTTIYTLNVMSVWSPVKNHQTYALHRLEISS